MYDVIYNIISHAWQTSNSSSSTEQQIIFYICGVLIVILTVVFLDTIKDVFRHFWRP